MWQILGISFKLNVFPFTCTNTELKRTIKNDLGQKYAELTHNAIGYYNIMHYLNGL